MEKKKEEEEKYPYRKYMRESSVFFLLLITCQRLTNSPIWLDYHTNSPSCHYLPTHRCDYYNYCERATVHLSPSVRSYDAHSYTRASSSSSCVHLSSSSHNLHRYCSYRTAKGPNTPKARWDYSAKSLTCVDDLSPTVDAPALAWFDASPECQCRTLSRRAPSRHHNHCKETLMCLRHHRHRAYLQNGSCYRVDCGDLSLMNRDCYVLVWNLCGFFCWRCSWRCWLWPYGAGWC